jgi:uncharacterized protein (UPF0305 family)
MSNHRVYLDDIYANEACKGSTFRAVVMMAKEARFINDQARQGYIDLTMKPTTIAMDKFKSNRIEILTKAEAEARAKARAEEESAAKESPIAQTDNSVASDEAANDAFGI